MLHLRGVVLAIAASLFGCYKPAAFDSCEIDCAGNGSCPNGLVCNAQNRCATSATATCSAPTVDGSESSDGSVTDGDPSIDAMPDAPSACGWSTSNVDACEVNADQATQDFIVNQADVIDIDTDALVITRNGAQVGLTFVAQTQASAPIPVAMLRLRDFVVSPDAMITMRGARPLLVFVNRTATIAGSTLVEPVERDTAANAALCDDATEPTIANHGFPGLPVNTAMAGGGGGGGGSFGGNKTTTGGAKGGRGSDGAGTGGDGGLGGRIRQLASLVPLRGGCPGGRGGNVNGTGGALGGLAGGAIQISARTRLTITGTIEVPGGIGEAAVNRGPGHGGGGSGGGILLEAPTLALAQSLLCANGGGGGGGSGIIVAAAPLPVRGCADMPPPNTDPSAGQGATWSFDATTPSDRDDAMIEGGFGGGGGVGMIRVHGTLESAPNVASPMYQSF